MARKKPKRQYHDHRGDGGRFAQRPQATISTPQGTRQTTYGINPFAMSVQQQGYLAGAGPGWWISDHMAELQNFRSWIYVSVHKIAQQWAQATCNVYDDTTDEDADYKSLRFSHRKDILELAKMCRRWRTKAHNPDTSADEETPLEDHPIIDLLKKPNPFTSGIQFRYQVACQTRLTGGAYIWEVPGVNQLTGLATKGPAALWVLPRGWCRPLPPTGALPNGAYWVTPIFNTFTQGITSPSQSQWMIPFEQMIDVKFPNPIYPGEGTSPLSACSQIIDIMTQTDTATWASFVNSVKPSLVFNIDPRSGVMPTEDQMDQFKAQLEQFKSGANNAGKILTMLGLTVMQMMQGPAELDYVNGRDQNRKNVFGIQGLSETVAGFGTSTSYSEAAVAAKATIEFSVEPDLALYSDVLTQRWQQYWPGVRIEHVAKAMDDPTLRLQKMDKIAAGFTAGVISANEYRAELDQPPLDDPIADIPQVLLQPMLAPMGSPDAAIPGSDGQDPYAAFEYGMSDSIDTADEMADDTSTGMKKPDQQAAGGRMGKAFSLVGLNGFHKNGDVCH